MACLLEFLVLWGSVSTEMRNGKRNGVNLIIAGELRRSGITHGGVAAWGSDGKECFI